MNPVQIPLQEPLAIPLLQEEDLYYEHKLQVTLAFPKVNITGNFE